MACQGFKDTGSRRGSRVQMVALRGRGAKGNAALGATRPELRTESTALLDFQTCVAGDGVGTAVARCGGGGPSTRGAEDGPRYLLSGRGLAGVGTLDSR
jgi:hypothetical protein